MTNSDGEDIDSECDYLREYLETQIREIQEKSDINFQILLNRIENLESELFNKDREINDLRSNIQNLRGQTESGDFYG